MSRASKVSSCHYFLHILNRIRHLDETGLIDTWRTRYFIKDDACVAMVSLVNPATVDDIQGPIYLLGFSIIICSTTLLVEILIKRRQHGQVISPDPKLICEPEEHSVPTPRRDVQIKKGSLIKVGSQESFEKSEPSSKRSTPRTTRNIDLAFHS